MTGLKRAFGFILDKLKACKAQVTKLKERFMKKNTDPAPFAYENWKAALERTEAPVVQEFPLFTDAHLTGEALEGFGPYQFINTVPIPPDLQQLVPAIILRVEFYLDEELFSMTSTNTDRYHGGWLSDEIAALISLLLGVRVKAGEASRYFDPEGDPKGCPRGPNIPNEPRLPPVIGRNRIIPNAVGRHSLDAIKLFKRFVELSPQDAVSLVRAARLYQEAIWISESAPELSWIMFVSSIEIAATRWYAAQYNDRELFQEFKPDLMAKLEALCEKEAIALIAGELASDLRAAKKFREFIMRYRPLPPSVRPKIGQFSWKPRDIKQAMVKIYDYRCKALHGGIPFPSPMCGPPFQGEEIPLGLAAQTRGGVWVAKDMPLLLHAFEYIVRRALIAWWEDMLNSKDG